MAKATLDASDQRAQFEGQMAEAKLAAGDMQFAFDKLTHELSEQNDQLALAHFNVGTLKVRRLFLTPNVPVPVCPVLPLLYATSFARITTC